MKIRLFFVGIASLWVLGLPVASAQNLTSQGTDFWFAFMRNEPSGTTGGSCNQCVAGCNFWFGSVCLLPVASCASQCTNRGLTCPCTWGGSFTGITNLLYISSNVNTSGTIFFPGGGTQNFTVAANTTRSIQIDEQLYMMWENEQIENKGLRVVTNDPVNVFVLNHRDNSSDATIVLPRNTLRGDYYVMAHAEQPDGQGVQRLSEFVVVASEDNTQIDITLPPGIATINGTAGTWNITLNAGQAYQVRSVQDLTGTHVSSLNRGCKPFAVFGGNEFTRVGNCGSSREHLFEQMYPTATWGNRYVTVPFHGRNGDYFKIIPLEDNTQISINGSVVATLNRQQKHFVLLTQPSIIEGNKPIAVGQFARTQGCDNTVADPIFVNLSAVEQLEITDATFSAFNDPLVSGIISSQYINIYTPTPGVSTVRINGVNRSSEFTPLSGTPYSYARISVPKGNHRIQSDSGFVAFLYGWGNAEAYGYAGGVVLNNLNLKIISQQHGVKKEVVCAEEPVDFSSTSIYTVSDWEWDFGDGSPVVFEEHPTHEYEHPGTYFVKLKVSVTGACDKDSTIRIIRVRKPRYELHSIKNNSCPHLGKDSLDVKLRYQHFSTPLTILVGGLPAAGPDSSLFRGLRAELYPVKFIDGEGCERDTTLDLRMHKLDSLKYTGVRVKPVSCYGGNDGAIILAPPTGGTGRYRFSINNGATWFPANGFMPASGTDSVRIENLRANQYQVLLQDDSVRYCELPYPSLLEVTQPDSLVAQFGHTVPDCAGGGTVTMKFYDPQGGSGAYQFSADGGGSWQTWTTDTLFIPGIPSGLAGLRIRDAARPSCSFPVKDTIIPGYAGLSATLVPANLTGCGTGDGEVQVTNAAGGSGNYEYSIDNIDWQSSNTFSALPEGEYTLWMRDQQRPECTLEIGSAELSAPGGVTGNLVVTPITACSAPWDGEILFTNLTGGSGNYEFTLNDGNEWTPLSAMTNPVRNLAPGTYQGIWIRDVNTTSCQFRVRQQLTLSRPNTVQVDNDTLVCEAASGNYTPLRGLPAGGTWSSPDVAGVNPATGSVDMAGIMPSTTIRLVYSHPTLCADTFEVYVSANPSNAFLATPPLGDTLYMPSAHLLLTFPNYMPGERIRVMWGDGHQSNVTTSNVATHTYQLPGTFTLSFDVEDANGCRSETLSEQVVVVKPIPDPRIPNTFTPNGDGVNDTWRIDLDNARDLRVSLYNRWGYEVYAQRADAGILEWDGRSTQGQAAEGVYFYRLEYKLVTGEVRVLSGSVTLVR
ncbi:MAG: gliding motility-associated C-terminal domain-containing protein [Bacteroidetes bacterium]|nr:gliding motility-associated C-terminal domain-containing protein [Bacteroidota bacterium]